MLTNHLTPTTPHLVVAFADCGAGDWLRAGTPLALQNTQKLLRGMRLIDTDTAAANSLSPPHERVLARALGLVPNLGALALPGTAAHSAPPTSSTDGSIAWAALEAHLQAKTQTHTAPGSAWAFLTPCHWAMGREQATLTDPGALALTPADAQTLLAAMQPYFATQAITLHYAAPNRWLAEGEIFRHTPTASLDRVISRNVDAWLPASKALKLLQNEMQMLLYTHPVNEQRGLQGLPSVNSFWLSGSGALAPKPNLPVQGLHAVLDRSLAPAALAGNAPAHALAGAALDAGNIAALLVRQKNGGVLRLSLCGETTALTFETAPPSLRSKVMSFFMPPGMPGGVMQLSK